MTGSSASADIEQRVQRLAETSQRRRPDVSQLPATTTDDEPWPTEQTETQNAEVASRQPAVTPEARNDQVDSTPEQRPEPQMPATEAAPEEAVASSEEIDSLLAAARADLARDRLTTPAGSNALERFQTVLTRDPDNAEATSGLHAIVTRYVTLARRVARDGRFDKAESFLQRAERAGVAEDTLREARQQLAEMRTNR